MSRMPTRKRLEIDAEDDPVVFDAPAECASWPSELHHIARKRIELHGVKRRDDALLVSGGDALRDFFGRGC